MADDTNRVITLGEFLDALQCIHEYPKVMNGGTEVDIGDDGIDVEVFWDAYLESEGPFTAVLERFQEAAWLVNTALANHPNLRLRDGGPLVAQVELNLNR